MCYYYTPEQRVLQETMKRFRLKSIAPRKKPQFSAYYSNGFNHEELPVITAEHPDTMNYYSWGLVPFFIKDMTGAKDIRNKTLNARSETVFTTASYKSYIKSQRCLIPATGFIEWHTLGKEKYPYYIRLQDENETAFSFGGIYSHWADRETGETLHTFSILTTPANDLMDFVHNSAKRMPLILPIEDEEKWLDPSLSTAQIEALMRPYPADQMMAYSISKLVTSRTQEPNDPKVLESYDYNLEEVPILID